MLVHRVYKVLALVLMLGAAGGAFANTQYQLNSGDVIRVNVFGEPDLSFAEIRLTDAGTFSYPFVGEVNAAGKTPSQIERLLIEALKDGFLVDHAFPSA